MYARQGTLTEYVQRSGAVQSLRQILAPRISLTLPPALCCNVSQGFMRGTRVIPTSKIPFLSRSPASHRSNSQTTASSGLPADRRWARTSAAVGQGVGEGLHRKAKSVPRGVGVEGGAGARSGAPLFDPVDLDVNATTILRFLRDNCRYMERAWDRAPPLP